MLRKVALAVLPALLLLLLMFPGRASAHAVLIGTTPENWQVLPDSPTEVTLRFNEPVDAALAEIRVIGPRGDEITDVGAPVHPAGDAAVLSVAIPNTLATGTHTVSYQVVSADSHPVRGAFTFSVGQASGSAAPATLASETSGDVSIVHGAMRWLGFAGLALLIGAACFVVLCWPGGRTRTGVRRILLGGWTALVVSTVGTLLGYGPYVTGRPLSDAFPLLGPTLTSRLGVALLVRLALLGLAAAVSRPLLRVLREPAPTPAREPVREPALAGARTGGSSARGKERKPEPVRRQQVLRPAGQRRNRVAAAGMLGFAVALSLTWSFADHAATGSLVPLALLADAAHLTTMSVWLGGLVVLACVALRSGDVLGLRLAVPRYSTMAFTCVVVLAVTGLFQAWRQTGSVAALTGTTYGLLLLGKTGLVALLVGLGWFSRTWVRRHYHFEIVSVADKRRARRGPPPTELRRFRRTVAAETAIAALVLGVTSAMVSVEPATAQLAREAATPQAPAYTGPVNVVVPYDSGGGNGSGQLAVSVLPGAVGVNQIHISVLGPRLEPRDVAEVKAEFRLPERNLGPLPVDLDYDGAGHYLSLGASLPMPGQWELAITVRTSEFDQAVVRIPVGAR